MEPERILRQPVYLLVDASGSTRRSGLNAACNQALPALIDTLESETSARFQVSILTYSSDAQTLLAMTDPQVIEFLPEIPACGFSSLAAGLRLLGSTMLQDHQQLIADKIHARPALAVVVTDGYPTDSADDLRAAYQDCCADASSLLDAMLIILAGRDVASCVAGLGQGLARPDVDVVALQAVDSRVVVTAVADWLARERSGA